MTNNKTAAALVLAALTGLAGGTFATAQTPPTAPPTLSQADIARERVFETEAGGIVEIKANGAVTIAVDDASTGQPIFKSGRVRARTVDADGKLNIAITAEGAYVVIVEADGTAVLYRGPNRVKVADLQPG